MEEKSKFFFEKAQDQTNKYRLGFFLKLLNGLNYKALDVKHIELELVQTYVLDFMCPVSTSPPFKFSIFGPIASVHKLHLELNSSI